jgi:putative membrane protein
MMGWYGFGPVMWLMGALVMLLFWAGLIVLIVWAVRQFGPGQQSSAEEPMEILRRRLAAGEITPEEYEQARRALQG